MSTTSPRRGVYRSHVRNPRIVRRGLPAPESQAPAGLYPPFYPPAHLQGA